MSALKVGGNFDRAQVQHINSTNITNIAFPDDFSKALVAFEFGIQAPVASNLIRHSPPPTSPALSRFRRRSPRSQNASNMRHINPPLNGRSTAHIPNCTRRVGYCLREHYLKALRCWHRG